MVKIDSNNGHLAEQIVEFAPAIILVFNISSGKYLYINEGLQTILGYERETFLKKGVAYSFSLMHPDDIPRVQKEHEAAMRIANKKENTDRVDKQFVTFEYRLKHKDGSWKWLQTSMAIFSRDKKGKVENIVTTSVDATKWKEEALEAAERLRESEERYRIVVEYSRDIILALDMEGKITYASPANEKIFGYKPEDSFGLGAFDIVHPDDRQIMLDAFSELPKSIGKVFTYRARHKDGHYIPVEGVGALVYDDKKKPYMIVGTIRDITQRVALEKQKDTFIAIASHELKTPVTSIKGYAEILQAHFKKTGDEKTALFLTKMNGQLDKLTSLINDLLDVIRVEEGKLQFKNTEFDFNTLVLEVIDEMQRTTKRHMIIKKLNKTCSVFGDRDRIGQVLTNLISNAIKYSPYTNDIVVKTKISKSKVTASIQDFGMGISPENQQKVFERFYRVSGSELHSSGLGLGLFISSEIVKRHNGTIKLRSKKGEGTTFSITLPFVE